MKGIVVLSLFDGMSCGRIALDRAGIPVKKYYASEIDKYAQIVSEANYSDIIRLGDVTKWREWTIERPAVIIGGSPCQGFSFAGKGLNFDDPRSKLFFTFADIVKCYKPKYFLLENVKMKKEHAAIITEILGVAPIEINSALASAQNRKRLYWTNIPGVTQPEDKGILLKDIIESGECFINNRGGKVIQKEKSNCVDANYYKQRTCILIGAAEGIKGHSYNKRVYSTAGKSPTLTSAGHEPKIAIREAFYKKRDKERIYEKKSPTLRKDRHGLEKTIDGLTWRKLTPLECERLQTVPDNFTAHVSNTQRYKMLGNGWTVDVIAHIFRGLK